MTSPEPDHIAELDLDPNEASGLLRVHDRAVLDHFGWDLAFWSVLDEVDVADSVVLLVTVTASPPTPAGPPSA